jgi:hypothetical protein
LSERRLKWRRPERLPKRENKTSLARSAGNSICKPGHTVLAMSWLLKSLSPSSAGKLITFDGNGGPEVQVVTTGLVAEGGYSFVYSAREVASSGRCFAVKKVLVQDKEMRDSAEVELSLLRAFSGTPGFVKCYGGHSGPAERGQEHWMLLEYCANGSLVDLLYQKKKGGSGEYEKRAPLDEPRVLHVFGQVVAGVAHMHAQSPPISHRDLKLENVLCTADGRYVLCDFGSAVDTVLPATRSRKQAAAEEERISKHSTLLFRAPEMCDLWRGQEVGPKADVWALGCVLYCLAFNDHPFPADSPLQILNAAWSFPPDSRRSAELHEIIRRMLTPDPADRPSAGEVVRMVETVSQGEGLPSIGGAKARWTAAFEEAAPFEANFDDPAIQTGVSLPAEGFARFAEAGAGPWAEVPASTVAPPGLLADAGVGMEPFADFDSVQPSLRALCNLDPWDSASQGVPGATGGEVGGAALRDAEGLAACPEEPRLELDPAAAAVSAVGAGVASLDMAARALCDTVAASVSAASASVAEALMSCEPMPTAALAGAEVGAMLPGDAACAEREACTHGRGTEGGAAGVGGAEAPGSGGPCLAESGAGHSRNEAAVVAAGAACGDAEEDAFGDFTSSADAAALTGEPSLTASQLGDFTAADLTAGSSGSSPVLLKSLPLPAAAAHSSASPTAAPGAPATPPISIKLPSRSKLSPSAAASRARTLDARVLVIGQPAPAASVPVVASVSGVGSYENVGRGRAAADHPCGDGSFGAFGCEQDNTGFAAPGEPSGELARESDFGDFAGAPAMVST